jgi:hypothetical protein
MRCLSNIGMTSRLQQSKSTSATDLHSLVHSTPVIKSIRKTYSLPNLTIDKEFVVSNTSSFVVEMSTHTTDTPYQLSDVAHVLHDHLCAIVAGRIVYMALMYLTKEKWS